MHGQLSERFALRRPVESNTTREGQRDVRLIEVDFPGPVPVIPMHIRAGQLRRHGVPILPYERNPDVVHPSRPIPCSASSVCQPVQTDPEAPMPSQADGAGWLAVQRVEAHEPGVISLLPLLLAASKSREIHRHQPAHYKTVGYMKYRSWLRPTDRNAGYNPPAAEHPPNEHKSLQYEQIHEISLDRSARCARKAPVLPDCRPERHGSHGLLRMLGEIPHAPSARCLSDHRSRAGPLQHVLRRGLNFLVLYYADRPSSNEVPPAARGSCKLQGRLRHRIEIETGLRSPGGLLLQRPC